MRCVALMVAVALAGLGCAHTRPPERKTYVISEGTDASASSEGPGTGGAGAEAYCGELQLKCHDECIERAPRYSGIKKGSARHHQICASDCLKEFMECVKKQEELERQEQRKELRFPNMDSALGWLRGHKAELAVGTVVVVAGVAFVVATGGSGALLLTPLAL